MQMSYYYRSFTSKIILNLGLLLNYIQKLFGIILFQSRCEIFKKGIFWLFGLVFIHEFWNTFINFLLILIFLPNLILRKHRIQNKQWEKLLLASLISKELLSLHKRIFVSCKKRNQKAKFLYSYFLMWKFQKFLMHVIIIFLELLKLIDQFNSLFIIYRFFILKLWIFLLKSRNIKNLLESF